MNVLLDVSDLGRESGILASKDIEAQARYHRDAIVLRVSNDLEQLRRTIAALGRDDTELRQMPSDRIRQHRALTHEKLSAAVEHQGRLLLFRFRRHKSHRRSGHRLADGGSVVGVVLAALDIGLHIARWHQLYRVTQRLKLAAPMMRAWTGLDAYKAR